MSYAVVVGVTVTIYCLLTLGLNVIAGYAGQPHLGQAAFFGLGAYVAAILATRYGLPFWLDLPAALVLTGLVGVLLGAISLRLREDFLAITTIGLNFVMVAIFQYVPFFGGAMGITDVPLPSLGSYTFDNSAFLVVGLLMVCAVALFSAYLERTWFGAVLAAIKDDEVAAAAIGISVPVYKIAAFALGTAIAGAAGSLYAHFMSVVTPASFSFSESVVLLSMLVFGGLGTIRGALLGAVVLGVMPEVFRFVSDYRMLLYGVLLLLMVRFQPAGLLGEGSWLHALLRRRRLERGGLGRAAA